MSSVVMRVLDFLCGMPTGHTSMRATDYREMMLATDGEVMACGSLYRIVGKHIGAGVYDVSLKRRNP